MRALAIALAVLVLLRAVAAAAQPEPPPAPVPTAASDTDACRPAPTTSAATRAGATVTLNPATAWQPRHGEVILKVEDRPESLAGLRISACWSWAGQQDAQSEQRIRGVVHFRPSDVQGVVNVGMPVPDLDNSGDSLFKRVSGRSAHRFESFGTVPVAALRVIVAGNAGILADTEIDVGITSVWNALAVAILLTAAGLFVLFRFARARATAGTGPIRLITTEDGKASLSALQILVWSATIAFAAMYVMALSGNLINVPDGILVLLGLSGATSLATVLQPAPTPVVPPGSDARRPRWSDLVAPIDNSIGIDMTRAQMLFFTLVTAGFVMLVVLNNYLIPDIPPNYLALIGISNGVYVGARVASRADRTGKAVSPGTQRNGEDAGH
jgi:hypothetical protein